MRMTKKDLIRWSLTSSHHFTANVILNGCSNQYKKLKGLYNLAQQERVAHAQFNVYNVVIDGKIVDINTLEDYA